MDAINGSSRSQSVQFREAIFASLWESTQIWWQFFNQKSNCNLGIWAIIKNMQANVQHKVESNTITSLLCSHDSKVCSDSVKASRNTLFSHLQKHFTTMHNLTYKVSCWKGRQWLIIARSNSCETSTFHAILLLSVFLHDVFHYNGLIFCRFIKRSSFYAVLSSGSQHFVVNLILYNEFEFVKRLTVLTFMTNVVDHYSTNFWLDNVSPF